MPELSDFPMEILRMIAKRCDFQSRFSLRNSSKLMKEAVDQTKFVLKTVRMKFLEFSTLEMSFEYRNRHGNLTYHEIKIAIRNADSIEKTAKWMTDIFKNAEIDWFDMSMKRKPWSLSIKTFLKKVKENLKSPLKSRKIYCALNIDPFEIFDKQYCQRLTCYHDDPNFFRNNSDTLVNLDKVVLYKTMDITDQDVLSMKATQIRLISENFSAEMVNQLVDKFIAKGLIDSRFHIQNPKANFNSEIKTPHGFYVMAQQWYRKIDGDKKMTMEVEKKKVWFRIHRFNGSDPLTTVMIIGAI